MTYYDRNGTPITQEQWSDLFGRDFDANRQVARSDFGSVTVSTVWLGLDHNFSDSGPPMIFETMVFGLEDEVCVRYATEHEAITGHCRIVDEILKGFPDEEEIQTVRLSLQKMLAELESANAN